MALPRILYELPEPDPTVLPGIEATVIMPGRSITSGEQVEVDLALRNVSDTEIAFQTDRPLTATFVLPGTRSVVGAFSGAIAGTGLGIGLDPDRTALVPVIVAAWGHGSMEKESGTLRHVHEDLVPGSYGLLVRVPIYGQEHEYQRQELWSHEFPISVTGTQ